MELKLTERGLIGSETLRKSPLSVDQFAGVLLMLLLAPLITFAALTIALASRNTPFVAHRRVGRYGQDLWMLKIRSMWGPRPAVIRTRARSWEWIEYLPDVPVPASKRARDPRVTSRLAAFYRRFSIDELPQLLHVVTGKMRLVGPRPITFSEWHKHYGETASEVLNIAPGITGLWQILGRNRLTYAQRRRLDLFYVRHCSSILDWWVLLRTPYRVLSGRDSS